MDTDETCGCVFDEHTGELNECGLHAAIRHERDTWMARYVKAREETDGLRRELDVLERAHAILGEAYTDMRVERNKLREQKTSEDV